MFSHPGESRRIGVSATPTEHRLESVLIAALVLAGYVVALPQRAVIAAFPGGPEGQPAGRPPLLVLGTVTALLFAAAGWCCHPWPVLAATGWLVTCGVPLAFIDARLRRLPDRLTWPACAGVLAFLIAAAAMLPSWPSLGRAAAGGAVLAAGYLAAALISPGHVGLGDAKAAASAGCLMAWFGWGTLLAGTLAALVLAAACGLVLLAIRRASLASRIAYGPALIAGAVLAIMAAAHAQGR
jgi:leader peptidase (prepilin peptidase) / N-methyltransferase